MRITYNVVLPVLLSSLMVTTSADGVIESRDRHNQSTNEVIHSSYPSFFIADNLFANIPNVVTSRLSFFLSTKNSESDFVCIPLPKPNPPGTDEDSPSQGE